MGINRSRRFNVPVEWHLRLPVCRTMRGIINHLHCLPLAEMMWLCSEFDGNVAETAKRMWAIIKTNKFKNHLKQRAEKCENS